MKGLARQHNWLIHSIITPALKRSIERYATGHLLDIGCGSKPYKSLADSKVTRHTGVDHADSLHSNDEFDIIATAYSVPLDTSVADTILCTDVLEHLEEPRAAIAEAWRLLKPGGFAIYTVPLFWHIHEGPRDFFRFTKYGIQYLFEKEHFEIVSITPLTGFIATFSQESVYFLYRLRKGGRWNPLWWLVPPIGHLIQAFGYLCNKVERTEMFSCEYLIVARKP